MIGHMHLKVSPRRGVAMHLKVSPEGANEGLWQPTEGRARMHLKVSPAGANEGLWRARAAGEVSPCT